MPSSVHDASGSSVNRRSFGEMRHDGKHEHGSVKSDFLCRVKYSNTLPDIPFEAKFLACPFVSLNRFIEYKPSSLEKNFKFELLTEPDLGVHIDLINPETYYIDDDGRRKQHHPVDAELLEDEQANPQNSRRSLQHSKIVPWMRKTEYISSEFTRFGITADRQETKVGYNMKKKLLNENIYRDRASQITAINRTFEDCMKPVSRHPTKKGVTAVAELPLLPDFENWMHPFALVVFDGDPLPLNEKTDPGTLMSQALIRGMMDEEGEQFVTYFLPTKETLETRLNDIEENREFDEDYIYEYYSVRDYNWLVRNKSTKGYEQDNFLFSWRADGIYYNELETRVSLTRRKAKRTRQQTRLLVRNRPYDDSEVASQHDRLNQLLHPYDEKDEDDIEEEDENESNKASSDDEEHEAEIKKDSDESEAEANNNSEESGDEDKENNGEEEEEEREYDNAPDSEEAASDEEQEILSKANGSESD